MDLVNEYLRAVAALLPKAQRDDIVAELRDTILNRIEEREADLGRPLTDDEVEAVLREERYGYTLRQALASDGLEMEESILYPLLRRLETQGLLYSEWREEDRRKKRFYRLSPNGEAMLRRLLDEWRRISGSLDKIIEP